MRERAKFDRENARGLGAAGATSPGTFAVVSLVVAIRGTETKIDGVASAARLQDALERLAGDALSDGGENVLAAEVLSALTAQGAPEIARGHGTQQKDVISSSFILLKKAKAATSLVLRARNFATMSPNGQAADRPFSKRNG